MSTPDCWMWGSTRLSTVPSQLSSTPLHFSVAPGWTLALESLQSPHCLPAGRVQEAEQTAKPSLSASGQSAAIAGPAASRITLRASPATSPKPENNPRLWRHRELIDNLPKFRRLAEHATSA